MSMKVDTLQKKTEKALYEIREKAKKDVESLRKNTDKALLEAKTSKEINRIKTEFFRKAKEIEDWHLEKGLEVQKKFIEELKNL